MLGLVCCLFTNPAACLEELPSVLYVSVIHSLCLDITRVEEFFLSVSSIKYRVIHFLSFCYDVP